jgi:hypothetical protein
MQSPGHLHTLLEPAGRGMDTVNGSVIMPLVCLDTMMKRVLLVAQLGSAIGTVITAHLDLLGDHPFYWFQASIMPKARLACPTCRAQEPAL